MEQKPNWLERPIHSSLPAITNEIALFILVMLLAIVTRFYDLESRVMSHDESLHTYFSWLLYRGQGYQHSPMMHGPFQFHALALIYFLFGANDFTARIPSVLFSIATVGMVWHWRRYLGNWGAIIAGFLLVISPYMLYYGRYVRNESFVGFSGIVMLYAMLRHLEVGGKKYLYIMAGALALHFTSKETSFIYTAQALLFLAFYFVIQVTKKEKWLHFENNYKFFIIALITTIVLAVFAGGSYLITHQESTLTGTETAMPANPEDGTTPLDAGQAGTSPLVFVLAGSSILALIASAYFLIQGYTWEKLRNERSFDLLFVAGTIVLPQLSPFLINLTNVSIPTEIGQVQQFLSDTRALLIILGMLLLTFGLAIVAGLLWNPEKFWKTALIFWIPFTLLYTTIFTNSGGFFTGTIGSLGYWIVQQDVQRGSQPWYYYLLIQIPIYEFLPAIGLFLAIYLGFRRKKISIVPEDEPQEVIEALSSAQTEERNFTNTFALLVWWSFSSFLAFSYAGERMPWLTYHITLPMILITGWALNYLIQTTDWKAVKENNSALTFLSMVIFIVSLGRTFLIWNGEVRPFQGKELEQLQATSQFLFPLIATILSAVALYYLLRKWNFADFRRIITLVFFSFLAVLTMRASFRATYITYDQATEFLVYAHGATGIKEVIAQAEEISKRTTGGMSIALAYDASAPDTGVSWPFVWYLRDFTNQHSFDQPTRSLRDSVFVIVDEKNFDKIEPALGPGFYRFDYIRMWWPMQDYFSLVYDRDPLLEFPNDYACKGALSFLKLRKSKDYSAFCEWFTNPQIRAGIIQIWLNRDYSVYAQAKGRTDLDLATWNPADKMRLYIRQDIASQIWNYGVAPAATEAIKDPTEDKYISLSADITFDNTSVNPIVLNAPRSLAFAKDGTLYVADSRNHRIIHLDEQGNILHEWGSFADGVSVPLGDGTFNEPWGVAVGPDGSVYVTDTWNHRIEKFTRDGKFIKAWGTFGQGETPESFYGPRGIAVGADGKVYVVDTGNKRVVIFDANGNYITEFGGAGFDPGLFDEPVGIAVDKNGTVYVNDTWNQRIQTFVPTETENALVFSPEKQWDVFGWFGQSLDNKPFIAVNDAGHVFITDPEGYRVIEFNPTGEIVRVWGEVGDGNASFGLPSGIAIDHEGHVWVTDSAYNRILRFTLP